MLFNINIDSYHIESDCTPSYGICVHMVQGYMSRHWRSLNLFIAIDHASCFNWLMVFGSCRSKIMTDSGRILESAVKGVVITTISHTKHLLWTPHSEIILLALSRVSLWCNFTLSGYQSARLFVVAEWAAGRKSSWPRSGVASPAFLTGDRDANMVRSVHWFHWSANSTSAATPCMCTRTHLRYPQAVSGCKIDDEEISNDINSDHASPQPRWLYELQWQLVVLAVTST